MTLLLRRQVAQLGAVALGSGSWGRESSRGKGPQAHGSPLRLRRTGRAWGVHSPPGGGARPCPRPGPRSGCRGPRASFSSGELGSHAVKAAAQARVGVAPCVALRRGKQAGARGWARGFPRSPGLAAGVQCPSLRPDMEAASPSRERHDVWQTRKPASGRWRVEGWSALWPLAFQTEEPRGERPLVSAPWFLGPLVLGRST